MRDYHTLVLPAHYIIEGRRFTSMRSVRLYACSHKGYNGTEKAIRARYERGARTWAELARPINTAMQAGRARLTAQKKAEVAAICAQIDARKAAMP